MEFTNTEVATRFENLAKSDISVISDFYTGKLKDIPVPVAELLLNAGNPNIKAKRVQKPNIKADDNTTGNTK
ncbi:MAG: hypothetical protein M0Q26_05965 [Chitinophagaceae bacterium]|nr:hypothetical protein [Chitinophagaceae bacterium]MDP1763429.1 hypothetical protein [Sediminibacterium sp.]